MIFVDSLSNHDINHTIAETQKGGFMFFLSSGYKKQLIFSIIVFLIAIFIMTLVPESTQLDSEPSFCQSLTILVAGK